MHHLLYEDEDGNMVQEFDEEAIDWFIQGLEQLRSCQPGDMLATPSVKDGEDGRPASVGEFLLMKVESQ